MLQRVMDWLYRRSHPRPLEALQIEVTTRCLTRCLMCPRTALADRWVEVDLTWEAFERVASAFPLAQHVHLQGWGEPLLHPRLFDMIPVATAAGCRVGLTTNGMHLDGEAAERLLDLGVHLVSISIAGATRETHERLRVGADFPQILEHVAGLVRRRNGRARSTPKVELSYLMTSLNMAELPDAVFLAASLGVDELYAINLDYVVLPEHQVLTAFGSSSGREEFSRAVAAAQERASRAGLTFRPYPLERGEVAVCEAHPGRILFIAADGTVAPCTYAGITGQQAIPRQFDGQTLMTPRVRFGTIPEQDLQAILEGPVCRAFCEQFDRRRVAASMRVLAAVTGSSGGEPGALPPPPEPCRSCYKLCGL